MLVSECYDLFYMILGISHTHTHNCKTNEHNAAQNVRFLVSWIVKQEACSTPIGAFLQYTHTMRTAR